ncbi:hypothetical protein B0H17DRAFT_1216469 [Mycena rosella]|uniref:Uncharacterized protein n=1 Tax=Mycena rosella TaxID=1033263 RepID=A0AAD7FSD6_MYCRO|nr:hypothetical protein B0H17DRAFT_1216469 [Mycena rosella]
MEQIRINKRRELQRAQSHIHHSQSNDDIANLVAGILTDVTTALDGLLGTASTIPGLGRLLGGLDVSLNQVLLGFETLLAGVLSLVAAFLVDVAGLL